jgi:hypothetical protein
MTSEKRILEPKRVPEAHSGDISRGWSCYSCLVNFKGVSPSLGTEKAGKDVTTNIHENEKY